MRTTASLALAILTLTGLVRGEDSGRLLPPIDQRFAKADGEETPDFQKHVVPLFGRLGCNGRACHGSFQGRGGFRLSLFGYDFKADHEALFDKESPRVDRDKPNESLILVKPVDEDMHEGGKRYDKGGWEHHVLKRWIQAGASLREEPEKLVRLEIQPAELLFAKAGVKRQLKAIAVWESGVREDVTPLCRFKSNDDQIADVDENGLVTSAQPGDSHIVVSYDSGVTPVPVIRPVTNQYGKDYPKLAAKTQIDRLVLQKLRKLGVFPSELADDAEFLRRVRLDMTGTLPTAEEVQTFLTDRRPNKRAKKIDELLETPAYAAWWATKLCDFTGNNEQQLNNVNPMRGKAGAEWYDWIRQRVADNTPYDQLAEGVVTAVSRTPDQSYLDYCTDMSALYKEGTDKKFADMHAMPYYWARRDFRELEARAIGFAYSFMGIRIQCAQCHKHPFDQWSKDDFHQFKNFFSKVAASNRPRDKDGAKQYNKMVNDLGLKGKRNNDLRRMLPELIKKGKAVPFPEIVLTPRPMRSREAEYPKFEHAKLLGGEVVDLDIADPRTVLMDWLRQPGNRFFAPAFVNRVWASYFNVGIVNPPDALSLANPPSNRALLDYLSEGFVKSGFDMKWLHREIANSDTYQRSWKPNETNQGDERNFSRSVPRRLPAEVAYDAIVMATTGDAKIDALHADMKDRSIAIPSSGYRNNNRNGAAYALSVFGRSTRDSNCDCDRSSEASLLQTVFLQNDLTMLQMLGPQRGTWMDQLTRELKPSKAKANAKYDPKKLAQIRRSYYQSTLKIRQLKKQGGNEKEIAKLQKRADALKAGLVKYSPPKRTTDKVAIEEKRLQEIVNTAYLRSLSRYPSEDEMAKSQKYIQSSEDTLDGVRDLLWALVNTKEFIVNH